MATRAQVHGWLKALLNHSGPGIAVDSKVALAVCIYLAQPHIPTVACLLDLELGAMSKAEDGGENMTLSLGGNKYAIPRLPDVMCCPVGALSREIFMAMNGGYSGRSNRASQGGIEDILGMMSKKMFSKAGDGSSPVLAEADVCRSLGAAMKSVDGIERNGDAVLAHLSRTRESWDNAEDENGVRSPMAHPEYFSNGDASRSAPKAPAGIHPDYLSKGASSSGAPPKAPAGTAKEAAGRGGDAKVCSKCGKGGKTLSCSRCKRVRYCSVECQKSDWKLHKPDCTKA